MHFEKAPLRNVWMPYSQLKTAGRPLHIVRTEGVRLFLDDHRELIDGISSWWTACHGYNHPDIIRAIKQQLDEMPHVMMGGLVNSQAIRLCSRLAAILFQDDARVFLCDSGSVAVEVALKIAVQYWRNRGERQRNRFICFRDSYHGDTSGAMSVCDPVDSMHAHFKGFLLEQYPHEIPENDEAVDVFAGFVNKHKSHIAGAIIEPRVQMAAGANFHSSRALQSIRDVCTRNGILLIADEVATGFGRTGSMFACQGADVEPDIYCIGKALTGGQLGMAATVASNAIYEAFHSEDWTHALMHGPSFMGNPTCCAAANASLDLFENEPRLEQAQAMEEKLKHELDCLASRDNIEDVRALGAIGVVEFKESINKQAAIDFFVNEGVWIRPIGASVYLAPSLNIDDDDLGVLCSAIRKFADAVTRNPMLLAGKK